MSSKNKININIEANFEKLLQESVAFHQLGKLDQAEVGYKTLLNKAPNNSIVLSNLATIAQQRGDLESALEIYEKSLQVDKHQPNALNNYGVILQKLKRLYEAIKIYDLAISLKSEHAQAYANKANALSELKKFKEAQLNYDRAIYFKPDYPNAYFNKAKSYKEDGQIEKSLITFKKAIQFNSGISYIIGEILHAQMQLCIWNDFHNSIQDLIIKINASHKVILPFPLLALIDDPKLQKKAAEIYANDNFPENHSLPKLERYPKHSKIRIGYFSADFKMHPVATLTAELYETHDRSQFEIHAFSFGPDNNDEMNLRIKAGVDHFHEVSSKSDKDIALLARSLEIDIAVDLGGYTADSRTGIFAMRAAPIQVNYLGYPGTMGAKYMDYIIADRTLIPKEQQKHYTEKVVYLPDSYQSNMSMLKISNKKFSRNDFALPENGFVFCCFNNDFKITPTIFQSWMRILSASEHSVLWLFEKNKVTSKNLKQKAEDYGVSKNRIIFSNNLPIEKHLKRIQIADLFLDTSPYNAHTTTSDALRVGLPVITCIGKSFASRVAASLLNSVNLSELITSNRDEYESMAIELATDKNKYHEITQKLAKNISHTPLFNSLIFTKNIEAVFQKIYQNLEK